MAEKPQPIFIGLHTDNKPRQQPLGTVRSAWNAITETKAGDMQAYANEIGNSACYELPSGHVQIGHINMTGNDVVIFHVDPSNVGSSSISLVNGCTRTPIMSNVECLNFDMSEPTFKPIRGDFRMREGCHRTIYWKDGLNPIRVMDVDDALITGDAENPYRVDENGDGTFTWDCTLLKLFQDYTLPCIKLTNVIDSSGNLKVGVYEFTLTYLDDDFNEVGYINMTPTIPIHNDAENDTYDEKDGAYPYDTTNQLTSKAIVLEITNLDPSYPYVRIAVAHSTEGTGAIDSAYTMPPVPVQGSTISYTYRGVNELTDTEVSLEQITAPRIVYDDFEDLIIHDNRLIGAGVQTKFMDLAGFQQAANDIQVTYVTKLNDALDGEYTPKSPKTYFDQRTYLRDEVYALAIVWVFNDGSESPPFHIPGREIDVDSAGNTIVGSVLDNRDHNTDRTGLSTFNMHSRRSVDKSSNLNYSPTDTNASEGWDSANYRQVETDGDLAFLQDDMQHLPSNDFTTENRNGDSISTSVERWQIYNTAYRTDKNTNTSTQNQWYTRGQLAYWEGSAVYPATTDCNDQRIYPEGPVRHHKMPDNMVEEHFLANTDADALPDSYSNSNIQTNTISENDNLFGWRNGEKTSVLGLEFSNIAPPTAFAGQVQGFKIVRAIRDNANKTILDKGLSYHNYYITNSKSEFYDDAGGGDSNLYVNEEMRTGPETVSISDDYDILGIIQPSMFGKCWSNEQVPCWYFGGETQTWIPFNCANASDPDNVNVMAYSEHDNNRPRNTTGGALESGLPSVTDTDVVWNAGDNPWQARIWPTSFTDGVVTPDINLKIQHLNNRVGFPLREWSDNISFHGPETKFADIDNIGAAQVKIEGLLRGVIRGATSEDKYGWFRGDTEISAICRYTKLLVPDQRNVINERVLFNNRIIESQSYIGADRIKPKSIFNADFVNFTQQETYAVQTPFTRPLTTGESTQFPQVYGIDPRTGLSYQDSTNVYGNPIGGRATGLPPLFGTVGYPFSYSHGMYVSLKIYDRLAYNSLPDIQYVDASKCMVPYTSGFATADVDSGSEDHSVFNGDCFIGGLGFRQTQRTCDCGDDSDILYRNVAYYYVESTINTALRHSGDLTIGSPSDCSEESVQQYYPKNYNEENNTLIDFYNKDYCHENFYAYNKDFSKSSDSRVYIPLPVNFNWCETCLGDYPNMLVYSYQSFQEERVDNFRIFGPNNYKTMQATKGDINSVFVKDDRLYILTEQSLWVQQTRPQELQTDAGSITVGTGAFFALPPKEVKETETGHAGSQHKYANILTPYGAVIVDAASGSVYLLQDSIREISALGMHSFFEEKLPMVLPDQYLAVVGTEYPGNDNLAHPTGVGIMCTFDNRYDRLILTKRDYKIKDNITFRGLTEEADSNTEDGLLYNLTNRTFEQQQTITVDGTTTTKITTVEFGDPAFFENRSFTISFNFKANQGNGAWISYHHYFPRWIYSDRDTFYTNQPGSSWKHNSGNFQTFYTAKYPHIIEPVINHSPITTTTLNTCKYISNVSLYDTTNMQWIEQPYKTFNSLIAYNDLQSTGELTIVSKKDFSSVPYLSLVNLNTTAYATKKDNYWCINKLRDMVIDRTIPHFSSDQTATNADGTDKFVNLTAINTNKSQYEQARLRDKYLGLRFKFNPEENYKITTDLVSVSLDQSFR